MLPNWTKTLGSMIDGYSEVKAYCDGCRKHRLLTVDDLIALAERVGRDYSLIDRRCKCRITPGCTGWCDFHYLHGVMRPLRNPGRDLHWSMVDWEAKKRGS